MSKILKFKLSQIRFFKVDYHFKDIFCQESLFIAFFRQFFGQSCLMSPNSSSWTFACECMAFDRRNFKQLWFAIVLN